MFTCILLIRIAYQTISNCFHRNKNSVNNILIYGANSNGTMILHKINNSANSNIKVLGFIDENPDLEGKLLCGYPILGEHWKLDKTLPNKTKVDCIVTSEEDLRSMKFNSLKSLADENGIKIEHVQLKLKSIMTNSSNKHSISSKLSELSILNI